MKPKDTNEESGASDAAQPVVRQKAGVRLAELTEIELVIEKLIAGGDGFGRFEGIPIFVPFAAPGDRLRVELTERRPDYGRAAILEILEAGTGRREPPCPHFGVCGGCDLQHLEDDLQTKLKAGAVMETLTRLGGVPKETAIEVVSGEPWGYRLRAQLQIESGDEKIRQGFFARGSHELVEVASCPILIPELDRVLQQVSSQLPENPPRRLDLTAGDDGRISSAPVVDGLPHGEVSRMVGDFRLAYDARCFFQANRELLEKLVESVVGEDDGEQAFELFAGVGLFTLPLARRYERVTAVEGDRIAARFARSNARKNGLGNIEVLARSAETWVSMLPSDAERVVVDPPRIGLSKPLRRTLALKRPRKVTYVSCHSATMARDIKALGESYELHRLTLLDLFPQTGHMEAVAQLRRKD